MALDFNRDDIIQSSKAASGMSSFFPVGGMRASELRQLQDNYARNIAPLEDRMAAMQNNMMRLQSQDIAFKRAQIAFEQEKDKHRLQKKYTDPTAFNRIDEILAQDKDPLQQEEELHEFARKNPQQLMYNDTLSVAYTRALDQLKTRQVIKDKDEAPVKDRKKLMQGLLRAEIANYPDSSLALGVLEAYNSGEISEDEVTEFIEDRREKRGEQKAEMEAGSRRTKFKESIYKDTLQAAAYNPVFKDVDLEKLKTDLTNKAEETLKKQGLNYSERNQAAYVARELRRAERELEPNYRRKIEKLLAKYDDRIASHKEAQGYTGLGDIQVVRIVYDTDEKLLDRLQEITEDYGQELYGDYDHKDDPLTSPDEGNIIRASTRGR